MMNSNALRAILSRWWVVALMTAVGALLGALPSPKAVDDESLATTFQATHTLLLNDPSAVSGTSFISPNQVTLLATVGEVPERVQALVDYPGNAAELASTVQVAFDQNSGALTFTTTQPTGEQAVLIADGFADETSSYLAERQDQVYEDRLAASRERVDRLKIELDSLSDRLVASPDDQALIAETDAVRNQYTVALEQNRSLSESPTVLSFTTIDRAEAVAITANGGLGAPRSRTTRGLLGAMVGGALGVGVAIALARLDRRIRTREQAEDVTGLRARVIIPKAKDEKHALAVVSSGRHDSLSDAYRTLRNVVGFVHGSLPPVNRARITLIVSAGPGEGKTAVSSNLAATFAETGQRTVAVNSDFRRPQLATRLTDNPWDPTPYILEDLAWVEPAQLLRATRFQNLSMLDLGGLGTPDELARVTASLLPRLAEDFDAIVVDTSPVAATAEVFELVPIADVIILVVRTGRTEMETARRTIAILKDLTTAPVLLVITGMKQERPEYYYDYKDRRQAAAPPPKSSKQRRDADRVGASPVAPTAVVPRRAQLDLDEIDEFLRRQPPAT